MGEQQLPLIAFDWSVHRIHYTSDGINVSTTLTVDALLDFLTEPHRIVAESTFESWNKAHRASLLERMAADGHEFRVYRPLHTARYRKVHEIEKGDAADARVIYSIAEAGRTHVYAPHAVDEAWASKRKRVNADYNFLRSTGGKEGLIEQAASVLGPYKSLTQDQKDALGNGTKYSASLLAAATFAASNASSRNEFERLLGLHGSAYPSLLRSDIHHHSFRHAKNRGVTWQQFRRQLRWIFSQLKAAELANTSAPGEVQAT